MATHITGAALGQARPADRLALGVVGWGTSSTCRIGIWSAVGVGCDPLDYDDDPARGAVSKGRDPDCQRVRAIHGGVGCGRTASVARDGRTDAQRHSRPPAIHNQRPSTGPKDVRRRSQARSSDSPDRRSGTAMATASRCVPATSRIGDRSDGDRSVRVDTVRTLSPSPAS